MKKTIVFAFVSMLLLSMSASNIQKLSNVEATSLIRENSPAKNELTVDEYTLALWHFNEGEGQVVHDESLHHNDGTLGPTLNAEDSDPSWVSGFTGSSGDYALSFDQWNDHVNVPDNPDGSLDLQLLPQFTIEFYTYLRQISRDEYHWNRFLTKAYAVDPPNLCGYGIYQCQAIPEFNAWVYDYGTENWGIGCIPPSLNKWVLVTVVYDGIYSRIYFNNVLQSERLVGTFNFTDTTAPLTIGKWVGLDVPWLDSIDGLIDEVRFSSITRSLPVDWWSMYRHDLSHAGFSSSKAPETNNTIWSYKIGDFIQSSPAVVDGKVYIGSDDHNVYCLNANTGALLWSYPAGNPVPSSPAIAYGSVYVGLGSSVSCLNATTGAFVWSYPTKNGIVSSPAVAAGMVYTGSNDYNVYCLNATTGAFVWKYTTGLDVWSSPAVADGRVYVSSMDTNVYCLDAATGAFVWSYKTNGWVFSSPAVADGKVYVGSSDQVVYCLDAATGAFVWSYPTKNGIESSPAVVDGKVYIGSVDNSTYCLNASDGKLIWSYTATGPIASSPAIADGKVYIGSFDSNVFCLDATTGAFVWSHKTGDYNYTRGWVIWNSPAVADGKVYMASAFDGNLYAFGPPVHDIAITDIAPYKTILGQGGSTNIYLTAENQGDFTESFDITLRYDTNPIETQTLTLDSKDWRTLTFVWNTTGVPIGNYTISAVADVVANETDTLDNTYIDGVVTVRLPTHDVAVVYMGARALKTVVGQGYTTSIVVTVSNQGDFTETFNVTAYFNQTAIMIEQWPDGNNSQTFWSMGDVDRDGYIDDWDIYIIGREFNKVCPPGENPADINSDGKVNVIDLNTCAKNYSKDIWSSLEIPMFSRNQAVVTLTSGKSATLTFRWNTTGVVKGNYTLSAYAWPVPGETDTTDNSLSDGWAIVAMVGDITGLAGFPDGRVDMKDIGTAAKAFGSYPGHERWIPNADITGPTPGVPDGKIEMRDISLVANKFGERDP